MEKILLTGFEPFGKYNENPTVDLIDEFDGMGYKGHAIVGGILPVEFGNAAFRLYTMIQEMDPVLVLSLGLAASRKDLNVEIRGVNIMTAKNADGAGFTPQGQKIDEDGPEYQLIERTGFRVSDVVSRMQADGIRAIISSDAGMYVCNDLIYRTVAALMKSNAPTKFGFVHMPWTDHYGDIEDLGEKPSLPQSEISDGIDLIIKTSLDF